LSAVIAVYRNKPIMQQAPAVIMTSSAAAALWCIVIFDRPRRLKRRTQSRASFFLKSPTKI